MNYIFFRHFKTLQTCLKSIKVVKDDLQHAWRAAVIVRSEMKLRLGARIMLVRRQVLILLCLQNFALFWRNVLHCCICLLEPGSLLLLLLFFELCTRWLFFPNLNLSLTISLSLSFFYSLAISLSTLSSKERFK